MSLVLKPGVKLELLAPQMLIGLIITEQVFESYGCSCRVTSAYRPDSKLHSVGRAVDVGIRDLKGAVYEDDLLDGILSELQHRLGKKYGGEFDVVDERDAVGGPHIHIEYDPQ